MAKKALKTIDKNVDRVGYWAGFIKLINDNWTTVTSLGLAGVLGWLGAQFEAVQAWPWYQQGFVGIVLLAVSAFVVTGIRAFTANRERAMREEHPESVMAAIETLKAEQQEFNQAVASAFNSQRDRDHLAAYNSEIHTAIYRLSAPARNADPEIDFEEWTARYEACLRLMSFQCGRLDKYYDGDLWERVETVSLQKTKAPEFVAEANVFKDDEFREKYLSFLVQVDNYNAYAMGEAYSAYSRACGAPSLPKFDFS